jgi:MraZ protein
LWVFVAELIFQGPAALTLDGKGRVAIPARHRALLDDAQVGKLTITKHPKGYLLVFPQPVWADLLPRLMALSEDASFWKRTLLGHANEVEIDASSRVLIAPELRAAAGLTRDVMLLGMGRHLELWDAQRLDAHAAEAAQAPLPESVKAFTF